MPLSEVFWNILAGFVTLVDETPPLALAAGAAAVFLVGRSTAESSPRLYAAGRNVGVLALLGYLLLVLADGDPLFPAVFRSLLAGGLAAGLSWLLLSLASGLYTGAVGRPVRLARDVASRGLRLLAGYRSRRREAKRRREPQPPNEAERQQDEARREQKTQARKRREDARAACELAYSLAAGEIGERFSRQDFEQFLEKYMTDEHPPEVVEERARQLQQIIEQHRGQVTGPETFQSLEELGRWYKRHKEQIAALDVPETQKKEFTIQLNERYAELTEELIERLEP